MLRVSKRKKDSNNTSVRLRRDGNVALECKGSRGEREKKVSNCADRRKRRCSSCFDWSGCTMHNSGSNSKASTNQARHCSPMKARNFSGLIVPWNLISDKLIRTPLDVLPKNFWSLNATKTEGSLKDSVGPFESFCSKTRYTEEFGLVNNVEIIGYCSLFVVRTIQSLLSRRYFFFQAFSSHITADRSLARVTLAARSESAAFVQFYENYARSVHSTLEVYSRFETRRNIGHSCRRNENAGSRRQRWYYTSKSATRRSSAGCMIGHTKVTTHTLILL